MRPILRPGLRRIRSPAGEAVADAQTVRPLDPVEQRLLDQADGIRDTAAVAAIARVAEPAAAAAWERLARDQVVVDLDLALALLVTLPKEHRVSAEPEIVALVCRSGSPRARLEARRTARVSVVGPGPVGIRLAATLEASLLGSVELTRRLPTLAPDPAHLVVLTEDRDPAPGVVETLTRADVAHLLAGLRGATGVVGPFVVPGRSACLRCLELTRADRDRACGRQRLPSDLRAGPPPPLAAPASAVVTELVAALAAYDVLAWAERRTPTTVDTTVEVTGEPETDPPWPPYRRQSWNRHPGCGCGWDAAEATMGA